MVQCLTTKLNKPRKKDFPRTNDKKNHKEILDLVSNDTINFILGVDGEGYREVLDFFIGVNENAYVWEDSLRQLEERSVEEVLSLS